MTATHADGSGAMFDGIAPRYDRLNRLLSLGRDGAWRRTLVRALARQAAPTQILDVATGTGDVALALRRAYPGAHITGVDVSAQMLALAAVKLAGTGVELVTGDGLALPFASGAFDAACVAFGLRNMPDRGRALAEMARVVRPGGTVAVLELGEPRGLVGALARFYVHHAVPYVGALLSRGSAYAYLARSIAAFPPPAAVVEMMAAVGLKDVTARPLTFGAVHLFSGLIGAR